MNLITPTAPQFNRLGEVATQLVEVLGQLNVANYLEHAHAIVAVEEHEQHIREWAADSLQVSAGFIAEDLAQAWVNKDKSTLTYKRNDEKYSRQVSLFHLNRRELRELVKFFNTK